MHPGESVEEKISLSERFGLWISFYPFTQDDYLAAVAALARALRRQARRRRRATPRRARAMRCNWALQRGSRSGRVAWQFAEELRRCAALKRA